MYGSYRVHRGARSSANTWSVTSATAVGLPPWLSAHEVRALTQGGLIEVGAHSVSHSLLAGLPRLP